MSITVASAVNGRVERRLATDVVAQLRNRAEVRDQRILIEEDSAAQKSKILGR